MMRKRVVIKCLFSNVPVRLIQQKPALRINPLSEKSMNPGAIKIKIG